MLVLQEEFEILTTASSASDGRDFAQDLLEDEEFRAESENIQHLDLLTELQQQADHGQSLPGQGPSHFDRVGAAALVPDAVLPLPAQLRSQRGELQTGNRPSLCYRVQLFRGQQLRTNQSRHCFVQPK